MSARNLCWAVITAALLSGWLSSGFAADAAVHAAERPAAKPRLFEIPIDKSKAEDPFKNAPPPAPPAKAAAAEKPAPPPAPRQSPAAAAPRPVLKLPELAAAQELTRQQREMMLATSGPRKLVPAKPKVAAHERPAEPDFSHVHWGYSGLGAPENWAKLPGNALCGSGKRQSPIDIRGGIRVDLEPIKFDYRPTGIRITDNGHTVQVDVAEGNTITVLGRSWQLEQIHFHRPSEERVNGKGYEMSAHFVHRDYVNNLAVIAVLIERGSEHPVIQTLWNYLPLDTGMSVEPPNVAIDLQKLLPERRDYYTYMGSLTTPPCTENVLWMVFKEPIRASADQIVIFSRLYPMNARPVQPTNGRLIKESR
ncbi:carbonic anhydrase [Sulfuricystis multivorans]|uniref:carbonic anhydrase n=1 Tax=Sulfuricystis multivorans TaxID=2211108 RepID=UPI000F844AC6|nr:carbonic anhydrase family protein [Sulfuricystis multivorans]